MDMHDEHMREPAAALLTHALTHTFEILFIVFILMVVVELLELRFSRGISRNLTGRKGAQFLFCSFLGILPGCTGTFFSGSMYMAGLIGFGGITATMISTSGDEAFVLISAALDPASPVNLRTVFSLFGVLFVLGIAGGFLAELFVRVTGMKISSKCLIEHHDDNHGDASDVEGWPEPAHFLKEHVFGHIIKRHLPKIFLWLFASLAAIEVINDSFDLQRVLTENKFLLLLLAAVVGTLPVSGPNLVFISLFAESCIPFSVLLTNSIVQDGHGLLPLLGYSLDDSVKIKVFNLLYGLLVGGIIFATGF